MTYQKPTSYFAAANSFNGFTSEFNTIFRSDLFSRIFILKGGPGTGKSTIMKRLADYAEDCGVYTERVYCSSDCSSLDGVIMEDDDKRIAVIDGTAPHSLDPIYPGSVDEIINLGDSFNIPKLTSKRDEIIELTKRKKDAYSDAYVYLKAAGNIFFHVFDKMHLSFSEKSFFKDLDEYVSKKHLKKQHCPESIYLTSFGKDGLKTLEHPEQGLKKILIMGDGISQFVLMSSLKKLLLESGSVQLLCPHPFSAYIYDSIFTENNVFSISVDNPDFIINANEYIELSENEELIEEYSRLIKKAEKSFHYASQYHFSLESFYNTAMDFRNNDSIYTLLIQKIKEILIV